MGNGRHSGLPKGIIDTTGKYNFKDMYVSAIKHDPNTGWSTHTYPNDDGQTARDVFNISNNDALLDEIVNRGDANAFEAWTRGELMGTATVPYSQLMDDEQRLVRTYDKYIDRSEFYTGIQVHSLAGADYLTGRDKFFVPENLDAYMGTIVVNEMPLSTAVAASGLTIGRDVGIGKGKNVDYVFNIPPGKGYGMWVGDRRVNPGWGDDQREFLLGRDLAWKPTSYSIVKYINPINGKAEDIWQVQMEFVGKLKHKK